MWMCIINLLLTPLYYFGKILIIDDLLLQSYNKTISSRRHTTFIFKELSIYKKLGIL